MADDDAPSFDLTREAWLPVLRSDGTFEDLSLIEVFQQAPQLSRLVGDLATQEFALLRVLLAILHDAIDGPRDLQQWEELWQDGLPVKTVTDYLDQHRSRFDLTHSDQPFLQTPRLRTAGGEIKPLDLIVGDVPNGKAFFTMRAAGAGRLSFAEAARWLVHTHAFDISGIKSGVVDDPRATGGKCYPLGVGWAGTLGGLIVEGDTLERTLLLNLIAFDTTNLRVDTGADRPAWRREPTKPGSADPLDLARRPNGVRDLYTWQSRRVRLCFDADGAHGVVLTYGDPLEPHNLHQSEPMTGWRRSPTQEKKRGLPQVYLPREHDPSRSAWRGLGALIAGQAEGAAQRAEAAAIARPRVIDWVARLTWEGPLPGDYLIRTRLISAIYGTQQSVIDEVVDDSLALPLALLHEEHRRLGQEAVQAVLDSERAVTVFGDFAADLATAGGANPEAARERGRAVGFAALDRPFRDWLAHLDPGAEARDQRTDWWKNARRLLIAEHEQLLRDCGTDALTGRLATVANKVIWLDASGASLTFFRRLRTVLPVPDSVSPQKDDA